MKNAEKDLAERTKSFARRIIRLYVALPREAVAQVVNPGTRAIAVAFRPTQHVAQLVKVPSDSAIRQTVSTTIDKERTVVAHVQTAIAR